MATNVTTRRESERRVFFKGKSRGGRVQVPEQGSLFARSSEPKGIDHARLSPERDIPGDEKTKKHERRKSTMDTDRRPTVRFRRSDATGNIFGVLTRAARVISPPGSTSYSEKANQMIERVSDCGDYDKALAIIGEYVDLYLED